MNSDLVEMVEYSFGSIWTLELLLLLYRDDSRSWEPAELVGELRSSESVIGDSIERLVANGLIVVEAAGAVRYAPATPALGALVRELATEYATRPAAIRRLIVRGGSDKLRSFSNSFKLRPDK